MDRAVRACTECFLACSFHWQQGNAGRERGGPTCSSPVHAFSVLPSLPLLFPYPSHAL